MKAHAAIDLSLRSTGITIMGEDGSLIEYQLIANLTEKNEEIIIKNTKDTIKFLKDYDTDLSHIIVEGLAFMGVSSNKDILYGNYWYLRCSLSLTFPNIPVTIVPVTQWRKDCISKERAKELKVIYGANPKLKKNWQKIECLGLLPKDVKIKFEEYVSKGGFKKDSIFDLTDSYFIAKWSTKNVK